MKSELMQNIMTNIVDTKFCLKFFTSLSILVIDF